MKNLSLIAAIGENYELGMDNHLIWKIPEDLKFYKNMTTGKNIIMGRKTLESMPLKALEKRTPIVMSKQMLEKYTNLLVYHDLNSILRDIEESPKEYMVVGGSSIYEMFLPYVDTMYLTEIKKSFTADSFFPYFNEDDWNIEEIGDFLDNDLPYVRNKYTRKKVKNGKINCN